MKEKSEVFEQALVLLKKLNPNPGKDDHDRYIVRTKGLSEEQIDALVRAGWQTSSRLRLTLKSPSGWEPNKK